MLPLFVALAFATATIFVQDSWAALAFAAMVCLILAVRGSEEARPWILILPAWGLLQLALGSTIYPQATVEATLHWMALAAVFLLASQIQERREAFLDWMVAFAAVQAVLCLAQLHTSHGKVLWFIPTGYDDYVYGTFQSYNNFAQFAELALPVALVRAFQNPGLARWYVLTAGLLYAAVVASTSRAGTILVTLELLAIPLLLALRSRDRARDVRRAGWILASIPAMAAVWTLAAGWDRLAFRVQAGESFAGRKEFLWSALEMARQRPWTGSGLGTFLYAYPGFAVIDLPAIVDHAHNDWVEFASEGGVPFSMAILLVLLWNVSAMWRNPWAIGCVAVAIHALVDFPFARVGVIGWWFALLGLLRGPTVASRPLRLATAGFAMAGCLGAAWFGAANLWYLRDTPASLARATWMAPGHAEYWLRDAQLTSAPWSLTRALQLNPYDSRILIEAGLRAEIEGDLPRARRLLLDAANRDKTWMPRWSLANFHYRRGDGSEFWKWAREAANTGSQRDFSMLFRLAQEMEPDPDSAASRLLPGRPEVLRGWIRHLLTHSPEPQAAGLEGPARRLLQTGTTTPDRNYVVSVVERFLAAKQVKPAGDLWNGMIGQGWLHRNIGQSFDSPPIGEGFDWRMSPTEGIAVSPNPGVMTVSFTGKQPEFWPALERIAQVTPAARYRLNFQYETEGPSTSGLRWRVLDGMDGHVLARSAPLTAPSAKEETLDFEPPGSLVRMQLYYEREPGSERWRGAIRLSGAELIRLPSAMSWRAAIRWPPGPWARTRLYDEREPGSQAGKGRHPGQRRGTDPFTRAPDHL
jgi:O-antigen ligase